MTIGEKLTAAKNKLAELVVQANGTTGKSDSNISAAVASLCDGYGKLPDGCWLVIPEEDTDSIVIPESGVTFDCITNKKLLVSSKLKTPVGAKQYVFQMTVQSNAPYWQVVKNTGAVDYWNASSSARTEFQNVSGGTRITLKITSSAGDKVMFAGGLPYFVTISE